MRWIAIIIEVQWLRFRLWWQQLKLKRLRRKKARMDRWLYEHGIDSDALPEIQELNRRFKELQQQNDIEEK
jgi:hypothetical protein